MKVHLIKLQRRWYNPHHVISIEGTSFTHITVVTVTDTATFSYTSEADRDEELEAAVADMHTYLERKNHEGQN